jgi:hypothetical protein
VPRATRPGHRPIRAATIPWPVQRSAGRSGSSWHSDLVTDSDPAPPGATLAGPGRLDGTADGSGGMRWLAVTVAAYGILHHAGVGLSWVGTIGVTRWADWVDFATPYAVVLSAAVSLHLCGQVAPRIWALYAVGATTYVEGHGIHLAANSISNSQWSESAHFWDEVAGHYVWYTGWTLMLGALTAAFWNRPAPPGILPYSLAILLGVTAATNALEGGTAVLGLGSALAFATIGGLGSAGLRRMLLVAYIPSFLILVGYGLWHDGFPQPSQLG